MALEQVPAGRPTGNQEQMSAETQTGSFATTELVTVQPLVLLEPPEAHLHSSELHFWKKSQAPSVHQCRPLILSDTESVTGSFPGKGLEGKILSNTASTSLLC